MSFLNQLKTQAKSLQTQRIEQDQQAEERCVATDKAARFVMHYLEDLAKQLSVIQPPGPAFTLDGKTPWPAMKLRDFRVDVRRKMLLNREVIDYISMGWDVVPQIGEPVGGIVRANFPTDLQRIESRLAMGPVRHERKEVRHPEKNTLLEIRFEYITQTRGSVIATTDADKSQIVFRLLNTLGFEVAVIPWPVHRIGHDSMDELAKRIVAQPSAFV